LLLPSDRQENGFLTESCEIFFGCFGQHDVGSMDPPDEDWVRQIQESDKNDCSVRNLNSGLAKECAWQNNHAILQGQILFYNKKSIRIKKTEGTATKNIRFYYVSSPRKPAPTVPSNQGFYQLLWDDLDRSTRSLKRTAPSQANNAPSVGLLITEKLTRLNDIMKTNEESTNGEFNVDFGKFFKKQATNLDVTIFEET
jgi:hypothetical protein